MGPFGLMGRAQNDIGRLKTVLESVGYYQGSVAIKIDSLPLDDPRLGEELTNKSAKDEARYRGVIHPRAAVSPGQCRADRRCAGERAEIAAIISRGAGCCGGCVGGCRSGAPDIG